MTCSLFLIVVGDVAGECSNSNSAEAHDDHRQSGQVYPVLHPRSEVFVDAKGARNKKEVKTNFLTQVEDECEVNCCSARTLVVNRVSKVEQSGGDTEGTSKKIYYDDDDVRHREME